MCSAKEFTESLDVYQQRLASVLKINPGRSFVCRSTLFDGAQIHIIGDLHGSLHSLLRVLIDLAKRGVLADDFSLMPGHRLLFLGDMVDRGAYGIECLHIVLMLKLASWDQVMITRGNHETEAMSSRYGLWDEIWAKHGADGTVCERIYGKILHFFDTLPLAIFLGCQGNYVQCCHGGFEPRFDPTNLLEAEHDQSITLDPYIEVGSSGFNWSDFEQEGVGYWHSYRGKGWCTSVRAVEDLLNGEAIVTSWPTKSIQWGTKRLKGFIRGHQDLICGCKLLCGSETWDGLAPEKQDYLSECGGEPCYPSGPFIWQDVFEVCGVQGNTVPFSRIGQAGLAPVFTFSNATVTQNVPRACYATLQVRESFREWSLQVHELDTCCTDLPLLPDWFPASDMSSSRVDSDMSSSRVDLSSLFELLLQETNPMHTGANDMDTKSLF